MEQLEVVERYLERMRRMYSGTNSLKWDERHFLKDDVYSFFIHCNHLRDWVLHLNKIGITEDDIKKFIRANKPIQICADLANSAKHCHLERRTWSENQPHLSGSTYESANTHSNLGVKSTFTIISGNETLDALETAEQCLTLWKSFIEKFKTNSR